MCWSLTASGSFALVGAFMSFDIYRREVNAQIKPWTLSFYLLYTSMELLQFFQYLTGLASTNEQCDTIAFSGINSWLTFIAHILVWLQPIVHNYYSYLNCNPNSKQLFKYTLIICCISAIVATISLAIGAFPSFVSSLFPDGGNINFTVKKMFNGEDIANIGDKLCTLSGPNHLYWQFTYFALWNYRPNWFLWLMLFIIPHFLRGSDPQSKRKDWFVCGITLGTGLLLGWLIATIYSISLGIHHEIWSTWCLSSMIWLTMPYLAHYIVFPIIGMKFI